MAMLKTIILLSFQQRVPVVKESIRLEPWLLGIAKWMRRVSFAPAAIFAGFVLAGCGGSTKPATPSRPSTAQKSALDSICREATRELLDVGQHSDGGPSFLGRVIKEGSEASDKILETTIEKVRTLPQAAAQTKALRNLHANKASYEGLVQLVRTRGPEYKDLPSGTLLRFARGAAACQTFQEVKERDRRLQIQRQRANKEFDEREIPG
jgi:hypothetical protein